jgi:four helix bundle protein
MKPQIPTSKFQKNSKDQAPLPELLGTSYPDLVPLHLELNDAADGNGEQSHVFDLEERTAKFAEAIIRFSKRIPRDSTNNRLIDQLVGCGTSIGANYREANESVSQKDFRFSISRCVKEAKETKYFLRLVAASESTLVEPARELYREGHELHMIFATIYRNAK